MADDVTKPRSCIGLDISFVSCPRDEITEKAEFRKVNALLQWVNNNVMHVENCAYIPISKENLEKLQGTFNQLTTNNCQELFPTQEGFFYGNTEYDGHYWEDVADVKACVKLSLVSSLMSFLLCAAFFRASVRWY